MEGEVVHRGKQMFVAILPGVLLGYILFGVMLFQGQTLVKAITVFYVVNWGTLALYVIAMLLPVSTEEKSLTK